MAITNHIKQAGGAVVVVVVVVLFGDFAGTQSPDSRLIRQIPRKVIIGIK